MSTRRELRERHEEIEKELFKRYDILDETWRQYEEFICGLADAVLGGSVGDIFPSGDDKESLFLQKIDGKQPKFRLFYRDKEGSGKPILSCAATIRVRMASKFEVLEQEIMKHSCSVEEIEEAIAAANGMLEEFESRQL